MHILLSSLSGSGLGYGHNAPANINDYLGRLVNFYHDTYTVTRVEAS